MRSEISKTVTDESFSTVMGMRGNFMNMTENKPMNVSSKDEPIMIIAVQKADFRSIFESARLKAEIITEDVKSGMRM